MRLSLGVYWQFKLDYERAIDCHRKAIELAPNDPSANNLGKTYLLQDNLEAAVRNFRLALREFTRATAREGAASPTRHLLLHERTARALALLAK